MERERRGRDYWREQLSEYWDGGLTIQEYCELKDLPYERRLYTNLSIGSCPTQGRGEKLWF